jgi:hypothetical protein
VNVCVVGYLLVLVFACVCGVDGVGWVVSVLVSLCGGVGAPGVFVCGLSGCE